MTYDEFIGQIIKTRGKNGIRKPDYYEIHHIKPKCLGGDDSLSNKIRLTAKEHYEAHRLLALENPKNEKLIYAWWCFVNGWNSETQERYAVTAEEYEEAKIRYSKMMSEKNSGENSRFYGRHLFGEDNPHYGKKHSEETRQLLSELAKNRVVSQETRDKISNTLKSKNIVAWNKGKKLSPEQYEKVIKILRKSCENRKIRINQYNLDGEYIKTWESATDAGNAYGIQGAHITDCCNGKRLSCNGFLWRYENDTSKVMPYINPSTKKVAKIDKNTNEIIEVFASLAEAAKSVNGASANITIVCSPKHRGKTYKGFIWKYFEDVHYGTYDEQEDE